MMNPDLVRQALNGAQTLPATMTQILAELSRIHEEIRKSRTSSAPLRWEEHAVTYMLSSLGSIQTLVVPIDCCVTSLLVGGDTSGRGTVNIGTVAIPLWIPGNATAEFSFAPGELNLLNASVGYTPPGGTTNWDVVLVCHARAVRLPGAADYR